MVAIAYAVQLILGLLLHSVLYLQWGGFIFESQTFYIGKSSVAFEAALVFGIFIFQYALYKIFLERTINLLPGSLKTQLEPKWMDLNSIQNGIWGILAVFTLVSLFSSFQIDESAYSVTGLFQFFYHFIFIFSAAAFEEILFRGVFYRALLKKYSHRYTGVLVLQAAAFAIVHWQNPQFSYLRLLNIFLIGIALGVVASKDLIMAILFHFTWNFLSGYFFGLPVSGYVFSDTWGKAQTMFSWEGSILFTGLLLLLFLFSFVKSRIKKL